MSGYCKICGSELERQKFGGQYCENGHKHDNYGIFIPADLAPTEDPEVLALCEKYGFGAVMGSASRQWRARDPKGALSVGECFGNVTKRAGDWMAGPIGLPMRKLYDLANGVEELEVIYNALYNALSKEPFSLSEGESDGKL